MTETVLALPLLVLVLALLLFLGRGMARAQRSVVLDRYEAWRQAQGAPGPGAASGADADSPLLNDLFFAGRAREVRYDGPRDEFPRDAEDLLLDWLEVESPGAAALAWAQMRWLDGGVTAGFTATHPAAAPFRDRLYPITHRHTRIGQEWKYVNGWRDIEGRSWIDGWNVRAMPWPPDASAWGAAGWMAWPSHGTWWPAPREGEPASNLFPVRDAFLVTIDGELAPLAESNSLAQQMRNIYLAPPPYFGPTVQFP